MTEHEPDTANTADVAGETIEEPTAPRPSPTSRARKAAAAASRPSPAPPPVAATEAPAEPGQEGPGESEDGELGSPAAKLSQADAESEPARQVPAGRAPWWVAALLGVAILVLGTLCWLSLTTSRSNASKQSRDQALSASKTYSALVLSYNYQHLDADRDAALPHLTGQFANDYKQSMDTVIKTQAPQSKTVVEGQVDTAALEAVSGSGKQITVIVFGQQKVTNTTLTQPRTDIVRLRVVLDRANKDWKISKINQI